MSKRQRPNPRHTREVTASARATDQDIEAPSSQLEPDAASWIRLAAACRVSLVVSNRAYNERWLADVEESKPDHYMMIAAIIQTIAGNAGGPISHAEVVSQSSEVEAYVRDTGLKVVPSNGVSLEHNGEGIGHAKYSKSRSVAILWEKIADTIYVTFDDHTPVPYHRAIKHLRDLRLGKSPSPTKARTSRKIIDRLENPDRRKNRLWNARDKYFK